MSARFPAPQRALRRLAAIPSSFGFGEIKEASPYPQLPALREKNLSRRCDPILDDLLAKTKDEISSALSSRWFTIGQLGAEQKIQHPTRIIETIHRGQIAVATEPAICLHEIKLTGRGVLAEFQ